MKKIGIVLFIIVAILVISNYDKDTYEDPINSTETPKKTYFDTPTNTYKNRVEALNISNTLQNPVNTYLDSRVDAMSMSRKSVNEGNKRMEEQDKAMEALTK